MSSPIQLLETVKAFQEQGKIKLSSSELMELKRQTDELLRRSKGKTAMKMPEGFEMVLEKLRDASPEEAYEMIVDFMKKEEGPEDIMEEKHEEKPIEKLDEGVEDLKGLGDKEDKLEEKPEKGEGELFSKDKLEEKSEEKEDKKPPFGDLEDKEDKEDKPPFDKKDEKSDKKDEKIPGKPEKDDIIDEKKPEKPFSKLPGRDEVLAQMKDKDRNRERMRHMKQMQKEEEEDPTSSEMGLEDQKMVTASDRAKKVKVVITPERNIVAHHVDHGPIFSTNPPSRVKEDENAIRRLANKIHGLCVYEGYNVAISKLGNVTVLNKFAGVDEGVETDHEEDVPAADEGIVEGKEDDFEQTEEAPEDDTLKENDTDHELTPNKVVSSKEEQKRREAVRARIKANIEKRKKASDVTDEADNEVQEPLPTPETDIRSENDDEVQESKLTPSGDTLTEGDVDFKVAELEKSYQKLYASKAEKYAEKMVEAFVEKFKRCLKIASLRMKLNLDDNPYKIASADVLTSDGIQFSDGWNYNPMDTGTAVELIEHISDVGHDAFINQLMARTADLLEKGDEYLKDAEADLEKASPVPVAVEKDVPVVARSSSLRREALKGNLKTRNVSATRNANNKKDNDLKAAISGSTRLGRRVNKG